MRLSKWVKRISLLLVTASIFASQAFAAPLEAKVKSVTGKVERKVSTSWVALKVGDTLKSGDVISTGFDSQAVLTVGESTVTVKALTRLTLSQLMASSTKDKTSIVLDSGSVKASVKHSNKKADFTVKTPSATASVRGTEFTIDSLANLTVVDGAVAYYPSGTAAAEAEFNAPLPEDEEVPADEEVPSDGELPAVSEGGAGLEGGAETGAVAETPKSTQFTEAKEISGVKGMAVYQGQSSATDSQSGVQTTPRESFAKDSNVNATGVSRLSDQETVNITGNSGNSGDNGNASRKNDATTTLTINIIIDDDSRSLTN